MELLKPFPKISELRNRPVVNNDSKVMRIARELVAKGITIPTQSMQGVKDEMRRRYEEFVQQQTAFSKKIREEIVKGLESGTLKPIDKVAADKQVIRQFIERLAKWEKNKTEFERKNFEAIKRQYEELKPLIEAIRPYKNTPVVAAHGVDYEL